MGHMSLIWKYAQPRMLLDIELVFIGEKASHKIHRVANLRARNVDMSA